MQSSVVHCNTVGRTALGNPFTLLKEKTCPWIHYCLVLIENIPES